MCIFKGRFSKYVFFYIFHFSSTYIHQTSQFYSILIRAITDSSDKRVLWEKDFGEEIQITDWETICEMPSYFANNSAWEMQFKIVHRLHVTPAQRHKVNPKLSNLCNKCKSLEETLIHCFWSCSKIQQFWTGVLRELENIFCCSLQIGPMTCLLGMNQELPSRFQGTHLLQIVLHCARKCITKVDNRPSPFNSTVD